MKYDFSVFQEPRGVMRIFQFVSHLNAFSPSSHFLPILSIHYLRFNWLFQIFAICALYTTVNFFVEVRTQGTVANHYTFEYPFRFGETVCKNGTKSFYISADVSSDARFFVATAVLSILYCAFIAAVYSTIDEVYTTKPEIPLAVSFQIQLFISCVLMAIFSRRISHWPQFWRYFGLLQL